MSYRPQSCFKEMKEYGEGEGALLIPLHVQHWMSGCAYEYSALHTYMYG